jgi:putative ABC transport system ATP-binding protein
LSVEPRVVLADEPTGNLDTATGGEIIELLANLAVEHGSTIIVATHDASLAARAPRRVGVRDGHLLEAVSAAPPAS